MINRHFRIAVTTAFLLATTSVHAQEVPTSTPAVESFAPVASGAGPVAPAGPSCELHVWATENYLGFNSGLLMGLGPIGAVADIGSHKNRVMTAKELMAEYLGPDVQLKELEKIGLLKTLNLTNYKIVIERPTPSNDALKANPELKAATKVLNARIKAGERISGSVAPCYAELMVTMIMYHKAMMYGSNLFTGILYRDFGNTGGKVKQSAGMVKNPLEKFPPANPELIETAQVELRDAFSKDFVEWSQKKLLK